MSAQKIRNYDDAYALGFEDAKAGVQFDHRWEDDSTLHCGYENGYEDGANTFRGE